MAIYTHMSKETIREILTTQYGIDGPCEFVPLSGGFENSNYKITVNSRQYVLTICEQKSCEDSVKLALLLEYLKANSFDTSVLVRNKDHKLLAFYQNKPVLLKEYVQGTIVQDFSDTELRAIGSELAKLHSIIAPSYLPDSPAYGLRFFDQIATYEPESPFYAWLLALKSKLSTYEGLSKSLIHSDLFFNNVVVVPNGNVVLMDFEEACYYHRVFDIGMALIGCCVLDNVLDLAKVAIILEGYQSSAPLDDNDKRALKDYTVYAAGAMGFWRHQNYRFTRPDENFKESYQILFNLAKSIQTMNDEDFLKLF